MEVVEYNSNNYKLTSIAFNNVSNQTSTVELGYDIPREVNSVY